MSSTGVGRWKPRVTMSSQVNPTASQINPTFSASAVQLVHRYIVSKKPITGSTMLLNTPPPPRSPASTK